MFDSASTLYNAFPGIYFDEYNDLPDAKRSNMDPKYASNNLELEDFSYDEWFTEEPDYSTVNDDEEELGDLLPLEGDEEVKVLTPNKLLSRLPILLAQKLEIIQTN